MRRLARLAGRCIVVVTDEPTSLTDAYAFIKVARLDRAEVDVRIVVNMASSARDGEKTYGALLRACEHSSTSRRGCSASSGATRRSARRSATRPAC